MKIVLDDIIYSKLRNGGISNYWFELSKYLLTETDDEIFFIEGKNDLLNFHRKRLSLPAESIIYNKDMLPLLSRILPVSYNSKEKFIYHSSYFRGLSSAENKIEVTTVYDFIHNFYSPFIKRSLHNFLKYGAIKRSKGVICVSKNTYNDLQNFCPTKSNQKVEVIYNGVSDDYFPISEHTDIQKAFLKQHEVENEYLLYIGARTNYKNFDYVSALLNENKGLKLVVVGGGNLTEKEVNLFTSEAIQRVIFIGSVTNQELNILYNNALALIYPSSYEGFGIPVIEAMRAGCPVIGLNNAVIREIAEESAILLNNLNVSEFKNYKQLLINHEFRGEKIALGLIESQKYSWEKCSRETHEFYKDLYSSLG